MEIAELSKKEKFIITSELGPPKGVSLDSFFKQAAYLKGNVAAANVTDQQAGIMRLGSLAACVKLKEFGIEPVMQMTLRYRNRIALQSDVLSAGVLGIKNILALTGDPAAIGDHKEAKDVSDIDLMQFLSLVHKMESGKDMSDNALAGSPEVCVGAALNPCVEDWNTEISKTRNKVESGAEFFQTQGVFDPGRFKKFMHLYKQEGMGVPVLAGIILLKSAKMANFMNEKIPGIFIPKPLLERLEKAADAKKECVSIAVETIQAIQPLVQGVHLMAIGWEELIPEIVKRIR